MTHVKQPALCADCEKVVFERIEQGVYEKKGEAYCLHHATLAYFKIGERGIVRWRLLGPLSAERAIEFSSLVDDVIGFILGPGEPV